MPQTRILQSKLAMPTNYCSSVLLNIFVFVLFTSFTCMQHLSVTMNGKPQKRMKLSAQKQLSPSTENSESSVTANEITNKCKQEPADLSLADASAVGPQTSSNMASLTDDQRQSRFLLVPHANKKPAMALSALAAMASAAHGPCTSSSSSTPDMNLCNDGNGSLGDSVDNTANSNGKNSDGSTTTRSRRYEPSQLRQTAPVALSSSAVAMLAAAAAMADQSPPIGNTTSVELANTSKSNTGSAMEWAREASQDQTARYLVNMQAWGSHQGTVFSSSPGSAAAPSIGPRTGHTDFDEGASLGVSSKDSSGQVVDDVAWAMGELSALRATWAAAVSRQQEVEVDADNRNFTHGVERENVEVAVTNEVSFCPLGQG